MAVRSATARWEGSLKDGAGKMRLSSGAYEGPYSFASRFEEGTGTNPEELIGAAHAGCFSMALSGALGRAGHEVTSIETTAKVHLEKVDEAQTITRIELVTEVAAPGLDDAELQEIAEGAKKNCPVSRLLAAAEISLQATLAS
jgi:lipoyl-dependent peroxiredoxin